MHFIKPVPRFTKMHKGSLSPLADIAIAKWLEPSP